MSKILSFPDLYYLLCTIATHKFFSKYLKNKTKYYKKKSFLRITNFIQRNILSLNDSHRISIILNF